MSKQIFIRRLFQYKTRNVNDRQYGFVPDIFNILTKFNLLEFLETYMNSNKFPTKNCWKQIVKKSIAHTEQLITTNALHEIDPCPFKRICSFNMQNKYWKSAKTSKDMEYITCLLKIVTCMPSTNFYKCNYCYNYVVNLAKHVLVECNCNWVRRSIFWDCIALYFPSEIMFDLQAQSNDELFYSILGNCFSSSLDEDTELYQNFILLAAVYAYTSLEQTQ